MKPEQTLSSDSKTENTESSISTVCSVCKTHPFKYTCPTCGVHYCSVACFKNHKSGCTKNGNVDSVHSKRGNSIKERGKNASCFEEECFSDDDKESDYFSSFLIPHEQLEKIKSSKNVLELLNEPFIQRAIISVLQTDNKEKALMDLKDNSEMAILIDELLICVGLAKRRDDGSIEFGVL